MSRAPFELSRFAAFSILVLIAAGGSVTSTGSGLAVPDWPLSYGRMMPEMRGGVFFEHGHRMIAGAVGFVVLALAIVTHLKEKNPVVRALSRLTLLGVIIQAVLGGITVLYGLPPAVSIVHACLAQTLFCLVVSMAALTSPGWENARPIPGAWAARRAGAAATGALYLQLVFGAALRHTGTGLGVHGMWALAAAGAVCWFCRGLLRDPRETDLLGSALVLASLLAAQMLLGLGTAALKFAPGVPAPGLVSVVATAHVVCGAALLAGSLILTIRAFRSGS